MNMQHFESRLVLEMDDFYLIFFSKVSKEIELTNCLNSLYFCNGGSIWLNGSKLHACENVWLFWSNTNYQKQNDEIQGQVTYSGNWVQSRERVESRIIHIDLYKLYQNSVSQKVNRCYQKNGKQNNLHKKDSTRTQCISHQTAPKQNLSNLTVYSYTIYSSLI